MKKFLIILALILLFMVSCTTTGNLDNVSTLSRLGKDGDLLLTGKVSIDKVDRVNICVSDDEVYGTVEGKFTRLEASIVSNYIDYDCYVPKKGLLIFSDKNAKDTYSKLINKEDYLSELDASVMENADYALYTNEAKRIKGLFTAIKASYVSYLTKNGIRPDYSRLNNNFNLFDNIICINNLPIDSGYFKNFAEEFLLYGRN